MAKSLKDQNNWKLWLIVAVNCLFYYSIMVTGSIKLEGLKSALFSASTLLPVGIAGIVATVLNALPSSTTKARLVFFRWHNPLPGHRAFSKYAPADPRIDMAKVLKLLNNKVPEAESEQNAAWYRLYKTVENDTTVYSVHRDFLLLRDYAALSAILIVILGGSGLYFIPDRTVALIYLAILVAQFVFVRQAAANSGIRMVTNVLAIKAAKVGARAKKS